MGGRGPGTPAVPSTSLPPPPSLSGSGFWGSPQCPRVPCSTGRASAPSRHQLSPRDLEPLGVEGGLRVVSLWLSPMPPVVGRGPRPPAVWGASPGLGQPGTRVAPWGGRGGDSGDRRSGAAAGGGASVPLSPVPSALSCLLPAPLRWRCGWAQYECFVLLSSSSSSSSHRLVPSPCLQPSESNSPTSGRAGPRNALRGAAVPAGVGGRHRGDPGVSRGTSPRTSPGGPAAPGTGGGCPQRDPAVRCASPRPGDEPLVGLSSSRCPVWPCRCLKSPFLSDDQVFRWFSCAHEHSMRFPPVVDDPNKRETPPAAHIYARGRVPIYVCEHVHACPRVPPRRAERARAANQPIRSKSSQRGGRPAGTTASPFSLVTDAAGLFPCPLSLVCLSPS